MESFWYISMYLMRFYIFYSSNEYQAIFSHFAKTLKLFSTNIRGDQTWADDLYSLNFCSFLKETTEPLGLMG